MGHLENLDGEAPLCDWEIILKGVHIFYLFGFFYVNFGTSMIPFLCSSAILHTLHLSLSKLWREEEEEEENNFSEHDKYLILNDLIYPFDLHWRVQCKRKIIK